MRCTIHRTGLGLIMAFFLSVFSNNGLSGQENGFTVRGRVYSASTGLPLGDIGVSARNAAMEPVNTNTDGEYVIVLPDKNEQLVFSYPGYKDKTVYINGRENLDVWLLGENDVSVSDGINTPSGEIPLRDIAGAVDAGRSVNFHPSPNAAFTRDLQGMMSGLNVTGRSGMPGEGAYIYSRGYSSLLSSSLPLVVVDGMIVRTEGFQDPVIHGFYHDPLVDIDKRDISSVVLLKDAASCGSYGVKGSKGVLLISTIPPRGGTTTLNLSVQGGISSLQRQIPVMDAGHYSSYVMEQLLDAGMSSSEIFREYPFLEYDPDYIYNSRYSNNTNWQDEIFRTGRLYNAHLTVRGGDARAKYSLSGGYLMNNGIVENTSFSRFNFRFNSVVQVSSKVDIGFNLGYTNGKYSLMEAGASPQTNPIFTSLIKSPLLTVYEKDQEGISLPVYDDVADFGFSNPGALVHDVEASDATSKFLGVSYIEVKLTGKLKARAQFGLDMIKSNERIFIPSRGIAPQGDGSAERSMKVKENQYYSLLGDVSLSYLNRFNYIHELSFNAGARYMFNRLIQDFGAAQNSATDEFKDLNSGKADEKSVGGNEGRWSWLNYNFSARYILLDRYIVSGNLSLDASSIFGTEVQDGLTMGGYPFALLPSAGIAWRISSEPFVPQIRILDEFKLRASYGLTGTDDLPNYYTRLYYLSIPYYSITGFTLNGMHNPGLKWETVKQTNLGLDIVMFNERMILKGDWYNDVTEDMITSVSLPAYYGYNEYLTNSGSCRNRGFDLSLYGRPIAGNFNWEITASLTKYRNEILKLENDRIVHSFEGGEKISQVGFPMGQFYGYRSLGVFTTQEEADQADLTDKAGRRFNAGDIHFDDLDGNGLIDEQDKTIIGDPHPDFIMGFSNQLSYKGVSLEFLIYIVRGVDVFNYLRSQTEAMSGIENQSTAVYNRWETDGQQTDMPAAGFGDPLGNNRFSSRWIEDGSYVRLKGLTLSYTFPRKLAFINELNFYITGSNLVTWTKYLGYDPEFSYGDGVLGQGIDYGKFPQPRSMVVGVRLGL